MRRAGRKGLPVRSVEARIRFLSPCLGAVRRTTRNGVLYSMLRDLDGRVIFLPTWWQSILRFAAKVQNRHQDVVGRITWEVTVKGNPSRYRRYLSKQKTNGGHRYAVHEAFQIGNEVSVCCVLPDAVSSAAFRELLDTAGRYRGISPFQPGTFGRFEVVNVGEHHVVDK